MDGATDLFGKDVGPVQQSLFGLGDGRMAAPVPATTPDPQAVRRRLHALLETARQAAAMPWPEPEARMWRMVFPNMANWLPAEEADELRRAFAAEMKRLDPPPT